jgi:hypothetical protein
MKSRKFTNFIEGVVGAFAIIPTVVSALSGVVIFVGQCIGWLETAVWKRVTPREFIEWWAGGSTVKFDSGLLGLNKILAWILDGSEVSLWLIFIVPLIWPLSIILVFEALLKLVGGRKA